MHTGRNYTLREVSAWTRRESFVFLLISMVPTCLFVLADWKWLTLPWQPMAIIGTAVAFITGFKNNASYGRLWEARQIWGAIVNVSRTWSLLLSGYFPGNLDARRRLIYRHIAWLTALRYALREPRTWESMRRTENKEFQRRYHVPEWDQPLEEAIEPFLSSEERRQILALKPRTTRILAMQGEEIRQLYAAGACTDFQFIELQRTLSALLDAQGRCERIKNFPYPRQFATLNLFFIWTFIVLVPFGLLPEFHKMGPGFAWVTIPAGVVLAWIFHTIDKIGEVSENPFEGSPNDIPVTALSRTIEIDLRQALGETETPPPLDPHNNILM